MDPNSGRVISDEELTVLKEYDPKEAAKYSVRLEGSESDIQMISKAVKDARRKKNKAAKKARKRNRS